jgi:type VI secretion system protein VasD
MERMVLARSLFSRSARFLATAMAGLALGAAGLLGAPACSTPVPPEVPKPCDVQIVTLDLYAADNINPNERGNPRPVVVRLYQLKDSVRMQNAQYDDILLADKATLEDDLLKRDELEVYPNDLVEVKFQRIKEASTLAGVALFHGPKGQSWKTFYEFPLPPGEVACGGRKADAGKPEPDPRTAFFIEGSMIDNGSQLDESMFPNAHAVRRVNLPKGTTGPESAGGAPSLPGGGPSLPGAPQAPGINTPQAPNVNTPQVPSPSLPQAPSPTIPSPTVPTPTIP